MPIRRPARSTLAILTASIVLPLGAARAASPTTSTTATATPTTTTAAQPTSETTTASSTATQTATTFSTSSSPPSSTTSSSSATTLATTTQTASTQPPAQWAKAPGGQDRAIAVSRRAHAASDPTDIISDFKFAPATITIHVGDTITWVNNGPAPHTATASNGSFDTGNLNKGQSASHTFTTAGTFAYICKIHPFMHGTVVVLAAASSSGSGSSTGSTGSTGSSGTPAATTATTAPVTSTGGLPNTGMNLLGAVAAGLLLAAGGIVLRRRVVRDS